MNINLKALLGVSPSSSELSDCISSLTHLAKIQNVSPQVKSYSDAVYFNYFPLGISLLFIPKHGYKPVNDLNTEMLVLDGIDLYNIPTPKELASTSKTSSRTAELAFTNFPLTPFVLHISAESKDKDGKSIARPQTLEVQLDTTGKDFVGALGEPDRKGGGAGPSSGSIGIWCEWSRDGIMVEFGGDEAQGPQAWERGKDAVWKVVTLFTPK